MKKLPYYAILSHKTSFQQLQYAKDYCDYNELSYKEITKLYYK